MSTDVVSGLSGEVVRFVAERGGGVSFPEILGFLKGKGIEVNGSWCIDLPGKVVLYAGMSEQAVDIIRAAMRELEPTATSLFVYLIDGGLLTLPVAKRIPKDGYKSEHWLPIVFWPKGQVPANP